MNRLSARRSPLSTSRSRLTIVPPVTRWEPPSKPEPPGIGPIDPKWLCWEDYGAAAMVPFFAKGVGATAGTVDPVNQCAAGIRAVVEAWCSYSPRPIPQGGYDFCGPGTETILDALKMAELIASQLYEDDVIQKAEASLKSYFDFKSNVCGVATI